MFFRDIRYVIYMWKERYSILPRKIKELYEDEVKVAYNWL